MPDIPVHYLGTLSRFEEEDLNRSEEYLLVMLSGPEPQRTIFEELLLEQLKQYKQTVFFVRGLPGNSALPVVPENITIENHLPAAALQKAIKQASFLISRCGYSTVMDLVSLKKKSVLIPTPAQTEQEYLAEHLMKNNLALCIPQSKFKLLNAIELAESFNYQLQDFKTDDALKDVVHVLIENLKSKQEN